MVLQTELQNNNQKEYDFSNIEIILEKDKIKTEKEKFSEILNNVFSKENVIDDETTLLKKIEYKKFNHKFDECIVYEIEGYGYINDETQKSQNKKMCKYEIRILENMKNEKNKEKYNLLENNIILFKEKETASRQD